MQSQQSPQQFEPYSTMDDPLNVQSCKVKVVKNKGLIMKFHTPRISIMSSVK